MERSDYHIHSCFSDGTDEPSVIVSLAAGNGLKRIALTDHNTLAGIPAFLDACAEKGIEGISGVELTTKHDRREIHLLGYFGQERDFADAKFETLRGCIRDYAKNKILQNETIIQNLADAGIGEGRISVEYFRNFLQSEHIENANRVHIARFLISLGLVSDINEAMALYIGTKTPYYTPKKSIDTVDAIKVVRECGGMAVIAHLGEYHYDKETVGAFLRDMTEAGADGFELHHPHNSIEIEQWILDFAKKVKTESGRELLLTEGSDYHGKNKPNKIGEFSV